tara:strand:- start:304 stop:1536 length:1233 start_codon:yes stop_codon:yes gene_type:complete
MNLTKYRKVNQNPSRGIVFTPRELVDVILSKIPESVYLNKEAKYLVPAFDNGEFIFGLYDKLTKEYGYTENDVKSRIVGIESSQKYIGPLKRRGFMVYNLNFLEYKFTMKFDVILGNPPYNGVNKQEKPWVDFYVHSYPMLKNNGMIMYVTPKAWISRPNSPKFQPISKLFSENDLLYVDLNVNDYFTGVGEDIGYQILRKSKTNNLETKFEYDDTKFELEYIGKKIHLSDNERVQFSILDKVENTFIENLSSIFSKRNGAYDGRQIRDGKFKIEQCNEFNIPLLYSMNKLYYIKDRGYDLGWKLFLNLSGNYFNVDNPDKYMPILFGHVSGQNTYSISTPSKESAKLLRENYSLKLIRYYIENEKTSGFNSGLPKLPWLGYDKKYTDSDLYKMFDLTNEEINEVENYVG